MTHVKFISTPDSWSTKEFIDGLIISLKWNCDEVDNIKIIHTESLRNNRQHFRVAFYDSLIIERLRDIGKRTVDKNIRSIEVNKTTVLMEIKNNMQERFKLNDTRRATHNLNHRTLLVRFSQKETLLNVINKLSSLKIFKINYLSFNQNNSFIRFMDDKDLDRFKHLMHVLKYRYKEANTFLSLIKSEFDSVDNMHSYKNNHRIITQNNIREGSNNNSLKPKKVIQKKSEHILPEEIKIKIDNCAEDLSSMVTQKFNVNSPQMMPVQSYMYHNMSQMPYNNQFPNPFLQPYPMFNSNVVQAHRAFFPQVGYYPQFY
ncbi:hypothetical protein ACKWTF_002400 [Chironomus riparius]